MNLFLSRTAAISLVTFAVTLFYILFLTKFRMSRSISGKFGRQQQQHKEGIKSSSIKEVIILLSQPRSGSTFLGDFISSLESMLYMYEPLQALLRLRDANEKTPVYNSTAKLFLQQFLECHFSYDSEHVLSKVYSGFFGRAAANICKKVTSNNVHLCNKPKLNLFNYLCNKYSTLFVKLLEPRLPVGLSTLIQMPSSSHFRIVYLLRDPRATFWSLLNKGWVTPMLNDQFKDYVTSRCKEIYSNLHELNELSNEIIKSKITILRYEDLIKMPRKMVRILSKFLDREISDDYIDQFVLKMRKNISCSRDVINEKTWPNWYTDAREDFVGLIERSCEAVMNIAGYRSRKKKNNSAKCDERVVVEKDFVDILNKYSDQYDDDLLSTS